MSYTLRVGPRDKHGTADAVAVEAERFGLGHEADTATLDHIRAIQAAVDALIAAVGQEGREIVVTISGHTNPEHAPRDGWAGEFIMINVAEVTT